MQSLSEIAERNDAQKDAYCVELYSETFAHLREGEINVLELGVQGGGSLNTWAEYFPRSNVVGVDINAYTGRPLAERVKFFQGRQEDGPFLKYICKETGIEQFDLIVDDAAHFGLYAKKSFEALFDDHLRPGGFYVIEDWGTGYWDDWPDGCRFQPPEQERETLGATEASFIYRPDEATGLLPKVFHSHQFGMVGFVKQLVDEAHRGGIKNIPPWRLSKFDRMIIKEGVVVIKKAAVAA